jgi:hypothetical protein
MLHGMLLVQTFQTVTSNFSQKRSPPNLTEVLLWSGPPNTNSAQLLVVLTLLQTFNSPLSLILPPSRNTLTLLPLYLYRKDERALPLYPRSNNIFWFPPPLPLRVLRLTALRSHLSFSLSLSSLVFNGLIGNILWSLGFESCMSVSQCVLYYSILKMSQITVQILVKCLSTKYCLRKGFLA